MEKSEELEALLAGAGRAIGPPLQAADAREDLKSWGPLGQELAHLLSLRNGFYAWGSALLLRPLHWPGPPMGIVGWNDLALWKKEFRQDLSGTLFFAEDLFGGQFGLRGVAVSYFDPETAHMERLAGSVREWCSLILRDSEFRTGFPLLDKWEAREGELRQGCRLLPKVPFAAGGAFDAGNLYASTDLDGMRFRAAIANQVTDLPSGASVIFRISKPQ